MPRFFASVITCFALLGMAGPAFAQVSNVALSQAKARLACGAGTVIGSTFLPNGSLQVTCSQTAPSASSTVLGGTGLVAPASPGLLAVAIFLVVVTGEPDSQTTTSVQSDQ